MQSSWQADWHSSTAQDHLSSTRHQTSVRHYDEKRVSEGLPADTRSPANEDLFPSFPNDVEDSQDMLTPLHAPSRRARGRMDSLSSMGSSVAPATLPTRTGGGAPSKRHIRHWPGDTVQATTSHVAPLPSFQISTHDSVQSLNDLQSNRASGGLEAWLQSQAAADPPEASSFREDRKEPQQTTRSSFKGQGTALEDNKYETTSDAGFSQGARSNGTYHGGRRSRRKGSSHKQNAPLDWEHAAIDADAAGLTRRERREPSGGKSMREWLEATDVDSQIAPEHRSRRREGGSGVMSASGVRIREGVRRPSQALPSHFGSAHLDTTTLTSNRAEIPTSRSMGGGAMRTLGASHPRKASPSSRPSRVNLAQQSRKEEELASPLRQWAKWMLLESVAANDFGMRSNTMGWSASISCAVLMSAFVKWCTGLDGWSGKGKTPLYGDLEAQRHWIELTLHLPPSQWYFYDLQYWGLDYPPLTALVSRWCGQLASTFPNLRSQFALNTSRGTEDQAMVTFMRATVLVLDLLIYTPAVLYFLAKRLQGRGRRTRAIASVTVLLQPAVILIDHGHFQYNTVMLGLSAAAFALLYSSLPNPDLDRSSQEIHDKMKRISRRVSYEYVAAAVFFTLSLCFKQMALYYAPAIFAIMLGRCAGLARVGFERGVICFVGIALATAITFGVVFLPWLDDLQQLSQVVYRIFPLARGLFEDKVSNIWCFFSVLPIPSQYKLKNIMSPATLARASLVITLSTILLPCYHLFAAAVETVHIEMFLDKDSKKQLQASEKRQAEGSVTGGSTITSRWHHTRMAAPSDAGTDRLSQLGGRSIRSGMESATKNNLIQLSVSRPVASTSPSPAASVLPYALLSTSLSFFLFGFQTHEKSILLPLLPLTLLMSVKADEWGGGAGKTDWEWAVLMNNVAMFSLWPLLQRDQVALQYTLLTLGWNWAIGYNPFAKLHSQRKTFVAWFSAVVHMVIAFLHFVEIASPYVPGVSSPILRRYPDLFAVLTVLLCTPTFSVIWLWAAKRQLEVGFACGIDIVGMQRRNKSQASRREEKKNA